MVSFLFALHEYSPWLGSQSSCQGVRQPRFHSIGWRLFFQTITGPACCPKVPTAQLSRQLTTAMALATKVGEVGLLTGIQIGEHTSELQSPCNLVCRLLLD